jgi:predicted extracellular nuclease
LLDLNADILGLCEVENLSVLQDLNRSFAKRDYDIIHYDSPDERGIDNVLLYDKSRFKVLNSRPIRNTLNGKDKTRDILYVLGQFQSDTLHIFVNHWPSNYGGVEQSIPKRAATANLIKNEIKKIQSKNAYAEIVLLGDFNEDPDDANVKSLEEVGLKSLMKSMIGKPKVGTYVYRGKDYFYDQIIINDGLNDNKNLAVVKNSVYILDLPKYRQQEGKYKHYPFRFWAGSRLLGGYSDHLAVKFLIKNVNFSK